MSTVKYILIHIIAVVAAFAGFTYLIHNEVSKLSHEMTTKSIEQLISKGCVETKSIVIDGEKRRIFDCKNELVSVLY